MKVRVYDVEWDSSTQLRVQKEFIVEVSEGNQDDMYYQALNKVSEITGYLICYAKTEIIKEKVQ